MGERKIVNSPPAVPAALVRYRKDIRGYFLRRLHMSPDDVDDLTQEVFVRFYSAVAARYLRDPLGYLLAIARHVFVDFLKDCKKRKSTSYEESNDVDVIVDYASSFSACDPVDSLAVREEIFKLLRPLPKSHRAVLLAHEHDGYTYQEVAAKLGFTKQTVEKYLVLAKASIRATCRESATAPKSADFSIIK